MNEVPLKQKEAPLLKAKIRCVCTSKLDLGELSEDQNEENGKIEPTGEALKAVISKNAATR